MNKFNFNIDVIDSQEVLSKSSYKSSTQLEKYEEIQVVDLGLPSKTLWCKYNIDVDPFKLKNAKDWYGNIYSWGELEPKEEYTWKNYKWCNGDRYSLTKYTFTPLYTKDSEPDHIEILELQDDVAYLKTNGTKKIPTYENFEELKANTKHEFMFNYNDTHGLDGTLFTSKHNGNQIFFPTNQTYDEDYVHDGEYWSSSANLQDNAYKFQVGSWMCGLSSDIRCRGYMIRGVVI